MSPIAVSASEAKIVEAAPIQEPTLISAPEPQPQPEPERGTDPRYRTCRDAIANGYGDYIRGVDSEYARYRDTDSDGIVCER